MSSVLFWFSFEYVLFFARATFIVFDYFSSMLRLFVVLVWLSVLVQVIDWNNCLQNDL